MPERARVLVTGAGGFVGRHLTAELARRGYRIRGSGRGEPPGPLPDGTDWRRVGVVGPETDWEDALAGCTAVVHLAALAHQTDPRRQPSAAAFHRVNALGSGRLAEAARWSGVERLVLVSSIGAVAETSDGPLDETAKPCPTSDYGRSKLEGERLAGEALQGSRVRWSVIRPVLLYGPGNPGNMARLLRLIRLGLPLPFAGFRNRRSFLHVGSLVDAIVAALERDVPAGAVYHAADDDVVSTADLVRLIAQADGRSARLWTPPPGLLPLLAGCGDAAAAAGLRLGIDRYSLVRLRSSLEVSNLALKQALGWRPRFPLAEALIDTLRRPVPHVA